MMNESDENAVYSELYLHVLWSTKDQQPIILPTVTEYLYSHICDLALTYECHLIAGQVYADHIQLILKISYNSHLGDLISNFKVATMLGLRTNFSSMKDFEWQKSDFSFSISFEEIGSLIEKIKITKPFLEEVCYLLDQNDVKYDRLKVLE